MCSELYSNDFICFCGTCFYRVTEVEFLCSSQDHNETVGGWTGITGRCLKMVNKLSRQICLIILNTIFLAVSCREKFHEFKL